MVEFCFLCFHFIESECLTSLILCTLYLCQIKYNCVSSVIIKPAIRQGISPIIRQGKLRLMEMWPRSSPGEFLNPIHTQSLICTYDWLMQILPFTVIIPKPMTCVFPTAWVCWTRNHDAAFARSCCTCSSIVGKERRRKLINGMNLGSVHQYGTQKIQNKLFIVWIIVYLLQSTMSIFQVRWL